MTEVIVALISALGLVLVALVGVFGSKINGRLRAVQGQVENDHAHSPSPNLRNDIDRKHRDVLGILMPMQRDIAWLMRQQAETDRRVDDIEDTLNPKEKTQ